VSQAKLVLATGNKGKLVEIKALLEPLGIQVASAAELGFTQDVPETGSTFAENAEIKARAVCRALNLPALADDSGLEVDALDGRPGVLSARYAGPGASDDAKWQKLLREMKDVPPQKRGAAFVCVMACCRPDGEIIFSEGRLQGSISLEPAGNGGFGYDPVFWLADRNLTVAQISKEEKNAISHRGRAIQHLLADLPGFIKG
jgi:XTP/dITP diphosphohydrolase